MNADLQEKLDDLRQDVMRSVRYHDHREGFLKSCHTAVMFLVALSGSYAVVVFGTTMGEYLHPAVKLAPFFVITALSLLDIVVGFATKAALHGEFKRKYARVERQMVDVGENASEEEVARLRKKYLLIEVDEPPVLTVLNCVCHNEVAVIENKADDMVYLSPLQRLLANMLDWRPHTVMPAVPKPSARS